MIVLLTKKCKGRGGCGKTLTVGNFSSNCKSTDLLHHICRDCFKKRYPNKPAIQSDWHRRKKYKLSQEELEMWLSVPVCQVVGCGYAFKSDTDVNFDHDHKAGHVRGVLCSFHNASIRSETKAGRDTLEDLRAMTEYVTRDRERAIERC